MSYSIKETLKLLSLKKKIDSSNKKLAMPDGSTYRDVPMLEQMAGIVTRHSEEDAAGDTAAMLMYIAQHYSTMGRHGIAADYYVKYLSCLSDYPDTEGVSEEEIESAVYDAAKLRNSYKGVSDSCDDIVKLAASLLGEEEARSEAEKGIRGAHIKYDPVENSPEYLAVIDEVEKRIDKELGTDMYRGKCHEIWALQRELLEKKGIVWRSPASLNPRIRFD